MRRVSTGRVVLGAAFLIAAMHFSSRRDVVTPSTRRVSGPQPVPASQRRFAESPLPGLPSGRVGSASAPRPVRHADVRSQPAAPGVPAHLGSLRFHEIHASNRGGLLDEDGRRSDWLELYNASEKAVTLDGCFLSDDPDEPEKWALPAVTLAPQEYFLLWCSGRGRHSSRVAGLDLAATGFSKLWIDATQQWHYRLRRTLERSFPSGWNQGLTVPERFVTGRAGFGYGDDDDVTRLPAGTVAVLIRTTFEVPDPGAVASLVLGVDYDDGFVAFLNGERVAAANAPLGRIDFTTPAARNHEAGREEYFDLEAHRGLLRAGKNVLAVAGFNLRPSTDMSLYPRLASMPVLEHAPFRLPRRGGTVVLTGPGGVRLDLVEYPEQRLDVSYGRAETQEARWGYFVQPTPRAANRGASLAELPEVGLRFEPPPGRYARPQRVRASGPAPQLVFRYTRDGSVPDASSLAWGEEVSVSKSLVLRVAGFIVGEEGGEERATPIFTASYLIGPASPLPTLSVALDPKEFLSVHLGDHRHGRSSERAAHLEVIEPSGRTVASTGFGLRLHGGYGRQGGLGTKKSYRAYFRKSYGSGPFRYPFLPGSKQKRLDRLVLRGGFNDRFRPGRDGYNRAAAYLRDEVIRSIHRDMGAVASRGAWYLLYINGESKGLYNAVERLDEDFLRASKGEDAWDIIKTGGDVVSGSAQTWHVLCDYANRYHLSDARHYAVVKEKLDLESFTAYVILNLWAQNEDWPHNNWYAARPQRPDGKWLFLSWDAEFGLGLRPHGYQTDSIAYLMARNGSRRGPGGPYIRQLFHALLKSPEYRKYFVSEAERHLAGALEPSRVLDHIQLQVNRIDAVMATECDDFAPGYDYDDWRQNVETVKNFARHRGRFFRSLLARRPFSDRAGTERTRRRSF